MGVRLCGRLGSGVGVKASGLCGVVFERASSITCTLESQWPMIMGYFGSFLGYFGV